MSWRLSSTKLLSAKLAYFLRSASLATSVTMLWGTCSTSCEGVRIFSDSRQCHHGEALLLLYGKTLLGHRLSRYLTTFSKALFLTSCAMPTAPGIL